jgi:aspartokinase/homoserine dehydrogenase 1
LQELDAGWRRRVHAAAADGMVLRYVTTVTRSKIAVGLRPVPTSSPLAIIKGSDNPGLHHRPRWRTARHHWPGAGAGSLRPAS